MSVTPDLASIASLLGDATRMRILSTLMDGRAQTATELAYAGGVSPSTTSSHLSRLLDAGLVSVVRQGRHRYYRLAGTDVARALEGLLTLVDPPADPPRRGPRDEALRYARRCYDHLAGEAGVRLLTRLRAEGLIGRDDARPVLSDAGAAWCGRLGIPLDDLRRARRPLCRTCLDWSERRSHLAGSLGAAVFDRLTALGFLRPVRRSRALMVTPRGESFLVTLDPAA